MSLEDASGAVQVHDFESLEKFACMEMRNTEAGDRLARASSLGSLLPREDFERVRTLRPRAIGSDTPLDSLLEVALSRYAVVIANPPYLGKRYMDGELRGFAKRFYPETEADLFAMFMERSFSFAAEAGLVAMVVMESWMFLQNFQSFRARFLRERGLETLLHMDKNIMPLAFGTAAFVASLRPTGDDFEGSYYRMTLRDFDSTEPGSLSAGSSRTFSSGGEMRVRQSAFREISGAPIAYWVSSSLRRAFREAAPLGESFPIRQGLATGCNETFLRRWFEVPRNLICFDGASADRDGTRCKKWYPYLKGGEYRKWYGNHDYVVNWADDGREIRAFRDEAGKLRSRPQNTAYYFQPGVTWTFLSASRFGARLADPGFIFDVAGSTIFPGDEDDRLLILAFLCSDLAFEFLKILNPTLNFQVGNIAALPLHRSRITDRREEILPLAAECVKIAREVWDEDELSWDFRESPLLASAHRRDSLDETVLRYEEFSRARLERLERSERRLNRIFEEIYQVPEQDRPDPQPPSLVPVSSAGLLKNFLSYLVGVSFGRFGGAGPENLTGVVPLQSGPGDCDLAGRISEHLAILFPSVSHGETLATLVGGLDVAGASAAPEEKLRFYLSHRFPVDHAMRYGRRPIYWKIAGGRNARFGWLAYLHGLRPESLARLRRELGLLGRSSFFPPLNGEQLLELESLEKAIARNENQVPDPDAGVVANMQRFSELLAPIG
jgi:hypothetical protein